MGTRRRGERARDVQSTCRCEPVYDVDDVCAGDAASGRSSQSWERWPLGLPLGLPGVGKSAALAAASHPFEI